MNIIMGKGSVNTDDSFNNRCSASTQPLLTAVANLPKGSKVWNEKSSKAKNTRISPGKIKLCWPQASAIQIE